MKINNTLVIWLTILIMDLVAKGLYGQDSVGRIPRAALPAGRTVHKSRSLNTGRPINASAPVDANRQVDATGSVIANLQHSSGRKSYQSIRIRNLVSNPDFEDENICTEYDQHCAPEGWIAVSLFANYYFDQLGAAAGGTHFLGLTAGSTRKAGARNFVRTRLLCGMRKGETYQLEFYVRSLHPVLDSIGIYFSPDDFMYERKSFKDISPQLWTADAVKKAPDPNGWISCKLDYVADGTEGYISFGHFRRSDITGVPKGDYNSDYYFFMDEVMLTPRDSLEVLCEAADSVRLNVYEENERHEYLNKKMYVMRKRSPVNQPLPLTIRSTPAATQLVDTLLIPDLFFANARYQLLTASHKMLDSFVNSFQTSGIDSIVVVGHTDSIGKYNYNLLLSQNRANAVKQYLVASPLLTGTPIMSRGLAYLMPVSSNATPDGRSRNRRVEVFVYKRSE